MFRIFLAMSHIFILINTHFSLNPSVSKIIKLFPVGNIVLFPVAKTLQT